MAVPVPIQAIRAEVRHIFSFRHLYVYRISFQTMSSPLFSWEERLIETDGLTGFVLYPLLRLDILISRSLCYLPYAPIADNRVKALSILKNYW